MPSTAASVGRELVPGSAANRDSAVVLLALAGGMVYPRTTTVGANVEFSHQLNPSRMWMGDRGAFGEARKHRRQSEGSTETHGDEAKSLDQFHFIPSCLYNPFGGYLYNAVYILWTIIDPVPTLILGIFRGLQGQSRPSVSGAHHLPWAPAAARVRHPAKRQTDTKCS